MWKIPYLYTLLIYRSILNGEELSAVILNIVTFHPTTFTTNCSEILRQWSFNQGYCFLLKVKAGTWNPRSATQEQKEASFHLILVT